MLHLTIDEARGLMLAAQGLLDPPSAVPTADDVHAMVDRLGVLQIDTISVVERTQYLVLWSRLGAYDPAFLDELLYPRRAVFEYWSHAASIVPMADYRYYRPRMLQYHEHMWAGNRDWLARNPDVLQRTLDTVRERGPLPSAAFERPAGGQRTGPWDWYGPKDSRRALEVLWTTGDLMIHSRRAGQKVYDLRERVLAEAFNGATPSDDDLPDADERRRYLAARTVYALGVVVPSWLWDYFRLVPPQGAKSKRAAGLALLTDLMHAGRLLPANIDGIAEPAYIVPEMLSVLERLRAGDTPRRTTLLTPFDSLIWDRARTRALFGYEVCFEAYVRPEKRRYGYYCLAVLHQGRLVGRLDPKMERGKRRLLVHSIHLEPDVAVTDDLLEGLAAALHELARFLGATSIAVERAVPELAGPLQERLSQAP